MNMKKVLAIVLAVVLLMTATIAGTIAWLMDETVTVTNTFTVGNINIDLKEHDLINGELNTDEVTSEDTYKIIPGTTQPKDPFVTVKAGSENCFVFVQIKEVNNYAPKYIDWAIGEGWTLLETTGADTDNTIYTYYRTTNYVGSAEAKYNVLAQKGTYTTGGVTYPNTLTKTEIDQLYTKAGAVDSNVQPQLIFKAFAVQEANVTQGSASSLQAAAWALVDAGQKLS